MNSPVSSLFVGDRLVSRCDDGLLEVEYTLFDRSEVLLSPGVREEGYMTTAGFARGRLYERFVTADLAYEAFAAMRGRHMRPLARSSAVREIIDDLGPHEAFQGGRFVAARGRYAGVWLDLDALAAACPLRNSSILFQALHLVLVLEEVAEDAPVRLLTSQTQSGSATGGRSGRRVDLEPAQRLPWALREMQAPTHPHDSAHDQAEVREEILRDLRARATAAAVAQPRLGTLATAIARTGESVPPTGAPADSKGMSSPPTKRMGTSPSGRPVPPRPSPRSAPPPPSAPPIPEAPVTEPQIRVVAARAISTPPSAEAIEPARVVVLSGTEDRRAPPDAFRLPMPTPVFGPMPVTVQAVVEAIQEPAVDHEEDEDPEEEETQVWHAGAVQAALGEPQTALAIRPRSIPPPEAPRLDERHALDPRLILLTDPDSERSASFRLLRDKLLAKKAPRIIAVSSGAVHEGKTTCAINLALALSERPATRVLLLEGNFFAPSLGEIFHIDALTRPDPHMNLPLLPPYCIARMMRDFHVAALVQQPGESAPVFNSRWFELVIGHLSGANYDHVVIDAAALDGSPAVTQVLGVADGVLLTARSKITTARSLRRAAGQIPEGRALGVTLMEGDS